ncbi:hypothetical protein D3C81_2095980 [compost metagenome]
MGDGREHLRTVLDEVPQLGLHGIEREDRLANLVGPDRLDRRCAKIHAEAPCALGKLLQGFGQATSGQQGNEAGRQQHHQDHDQVAWPLLQPPTA